MFMNLFSFSNQSECLLLLFNKKEERKEGRDFKPEQNSAWLALVIFIVNLLVEFS